jgi:hypothetical protein
VVAHDKLQAVLERYSDVAAWESFDAGDDGEVHLRIWGKPYPGTQPASNGHDVQPASNGHDAEAMLWTKDGEASVHGDQARVSHAEYRIFQWRYKFRVAYHRNGGEEVTLPGGHDGFDGFERAKRAAKDHHQKASKQLVAEVDAAMVH